MYILVIPESERLRILEFSKISTGMLLRLEELIANPLARAKETKLPAIGNYYINAGRYAVTFDIDVNDEKVIIISVVFKAFLHKILIGLD